MGVGAIVSGGKRDRRGWVWDEVELEKCLDVCGTWVPEMDTRASEMFTRVSEMTHESLK
jgi:hypothetical protein